MLYYVDGYNVTRQDPATRALSLERQRKALEHRMAAHAPELLGKGNSYHIVWDGAGGAGLTWTAAPNTEYTDLPTADDAIVEHVRASNVCVGVVTSDRNLIDRCVSAGARRHHILPSRVLFEVSVPHDRATANAPAQEAQREYGIPDDAEAINHELRELWGIED